MESDDRLFEVESRWVDEERLSGRLWMFRDVSDKRLIARLKDELVSTVSHELRTPLTSIVGSLGLLKSGRAETTSRASHDVDRCRLPNRTRLSRLTNDLLDVDRLQSGKLELDLSNVDLGNLLRHSIRQNQPFAAGHDV